MAKKGQKFKEYTSEIRHQVVNEKLNQGRSYGYLERKYDISRKTIETWVRKYRSKGHLGDLKRGRPKQSEETNYKEKYEILKKYLEFLEEVEQEKK